MEYMTAQFRLIKAGACVGSLTFDLGGEGRGLDLMRQCDGEYGENERRALKDATGWPIWSWTTIC